MPRLFTGIELPEHVRDLLLDVQVPLAGARWIEADDLHLTLRFAGDIDKRTAHEFADALARIEEPAFPAAIAGLGTFGGNRPKSLWAGLKAGPELDALAAANERAARNAGLPPEKRNFKAHVTLARLNNTRPEEIARVLELFGGLMSESFLIDRFALFSSKPLTGGGPYVVEEEFRLRGPGLDMPHDMAEW